MQAPIHFDRGTGTMLGASPWERGVGLALLAGSKVGARISHRGYNMCANLLKTTLPERDIHVKLGDGAVFSFPYGDGYWSKLLNRTFKYEDDLEQLLRDSSDIDYTLIDCGANYGYWSVLVSSPRFGAHKAVAIEPSSKNFARLTHNDRINCGRFKAVHAAIGETEGTARLSGTKHEAFSIAGAPEAGGEEVRVMTLDSLIDDGTIPAQGRYLVKLDVEGVEIEAMKGGARLLSADAMVICEEHGSDRNHTVSRYIIEQTPMKAIVFDPLTGRFEPLTDLAVLDRIKVAPRVGYNVFATASAFWEQRIFGLNSLAAHRATTQ